MQTTISAENSRADLHRTRAALLVRDELVAHGRALDAIAMPVDVPPISARRRR